MWFCCCCLCLHFTMWMSFLIHAQPVNKVIYLSSLSESKKCCSYSVTTKRKILLLFLYSNSDHNFYFSIIVMVGLEMPRMPNVNSCWSANIWTCKRNLLHLAEVVLKTRLEFFFLFWPLCESNSFNTINVVIRLPFCWPCFFSIWKDQHLLGLSLRQQ